ncbi:LAGLIDADG family homing endonuclease [Halalkalibacter urbisdiaboli]|uniref:LAGLIDADG family homing endonuclease n=1 Tax=Halalkalibacter urbisdiaboli TaxID=1960589 RepID=UPI000B4365A3|nr:LAGLIDADG family homing endonuclease [Halalkalibacter urbisdiaboli]
MKKTKCAWCSKEILTYRLKEKNYCKEHYGFANTVRNGTYIKQVKAELDEITWNKNIAYLIGIVATDGTLRKDRNQIKITSKSKRYLTDLLYKIIIEFTGRDQDVNEVTAKFQGKEYTHYQLQFTSTPLYQFCLEIGLEPNKTYNLNKLAIPDEYFGDFLRGVIDGDGNYNLDKRR